MAPNATAVKVEIGDAHDDDTPHTIIESWIIFARLRPDEMAPNPLDVDRGGFSEMGRIYSRNRRHVGFNVDAIDEHKTNRDSVSLSYYEHGLCRWMVADGPIPAGVEFTFDGRVDAGLWVPDEETLDSAKELEGAERRNFMLERARQACDVYTEWCNGSVYGYKIEAYPIVRDEDRNVVTDYEHYTEHFDAAFSEETWQLYGLEVAEKEAQSTAMNALKHLGVALNPPTPRGPSLG